MRKKQRSGGKWGIWLDSYWGENAMPLGEKSPFILNHAMQEGGRKAIIKGKG